MNFFEFTVNEMCVADDFLESRLILIDKPLFWSSFDVVNKIRILLKHHLGIKKIKVGHAGTLDPLASGLMIVCTGKMTKKIDFFTCLDKEYIAEITFGGTTPSFDLETEVSQKFEYKHITEENIIEALKEFSGKQLQTPPLFSAIRIDGKRAYQHARQGDNISLKQREITFNSLEVLEYISPVAKIKINCSKGTYIRSFADDLGKKLKSGAYLSALKRTKTDNFSLKDAFTIKQFENILEKIKNNNCVFNNKLQ